MTSGIPLAWAIGAASSVRAEEHSPTSATTRSREISFFAAVADSPASDRLSSTTSSTGRPSTPPSAFSRSTASTGAEERGLAERGVPPSDRHEESDPHRLGAESRRGRGAGQRQEKGPEAPGGGRSHGIAIVSAAGPALKEERWRCYALCLCLVARIRFSSAAVSSAPTRRYWFARRRPERLLRTGRRQPRGDGLPRRRCSSACSGSRRTSSTRACFPEPRSACSWATWSTRGWRCASRAGPAAMT